MWSDGDPPHPIASGVKLSRWYGAPGTYRITLSISDRLGGTAFSSKTLFVGGSGAKALRNPDNSLVGVACPAPGATPRSGAVEMTIPSYAVDPTVSTPNPCPDATLVDGRDPRGRATPAGRSTSGAGRATGCASSTGSSTSDPGAARRTRRSTGPPRWK